MILNITLFFSFLTNLVSAEIDPYREFLACVDEVLDQNPGMNPKVAEDICNDLVDDTKVGQIDEAICELFVRK